MSVWIAILILAAWVVATQVWVINAMRRLDYLERLKAQGIYQPSAPRFTLTQNTHACSDCGAMYRVEGEPDHALCPTCYEKLWNRPYTRPVKGGMYQKDSDTGEVTEKRQDDE